MRLVISIFGLCVRFQISDIEICNGRIDFKFSLKQCSYILVCGKNTFGAIAGYQKGVNNFSLFFCNVCRIPLLTYMEMEIYHTIKSQSSSALDKTHRIRRPATMVICVRALATLRLMSWFGPLKYMTL